MRVRAAGLPWLLCCLLACEEEPEPPPEGSTGNAVPTSSTALPSTTAMSPATEAAETGPSGPGRCARDCMVPADCCAGNPECPGAAYPNNPTCVGGSCVPATCTGNAECEGQVPGSVCTAVDGLDQCVTLCDDDSPCPADNILLGCGSPTDAGDLFCTALCSTGSIDCGESTCDEATGRCVCASDSECINGFSCV